MVMCISRCFGFICLFFGICFADQTRELMSWANDISRDFPFISRVVQNRPPNCPYVYFDNGATTQKPQIVIDQICQLYAGPMANVGRGEHEIATNLTKAFEEARTKVAAFIGAQAHEVIFTRGTTDAVNGAALSFCRAFLQPGDEVITTEMEHHSNYLPWQQAALRHGAVFKVIPMTKDGRIDVDAYKKLLSTKTKLVALVHVSNVFGVPNNVREIADLAHAVGARVLVDAAQSMGHISVDVHSLGADFLAFSGHKMFGPTGIGVLYITANLIDKLEPWQYGGGMVFDVSPTIHEWLGAPTKFEAGTPPIVQAIALGTAVDYLRTKIDLGKLHEYEALLTRTTIDGLLQIPGVQVLGPIDQMRHEGHLVSFYVEGADAQILAHFLDEHGIAVRAGYHCTVPLHDALGLRGSVRASFHVYNTLDEVNYLISTVKKFVESGAATQIVTRSVKTHAHCTAR